MPQKDTPSIKTAWTNTWKYKADRLKIIIGSVIILSIITALPIFFGHIEKRRGVVLHDWVLEHIPPHNVSIIIFIIIWGMSLLITYRALYKPQIYIVYCWSLIILCILRMISISIFALDPPVGLIPLADPLTGIFYGQAAITKDLFFSGHMVTVTLTYLCLEKKPDKVFGIISIIAVAILLVVQHIHYTIDIVAAPVITYAVYKLVRRILM